MKTILPVGSPSRLERAAGVANGSKAPAEVRDGSCGDGPERRDAAT
jgi:hypothetical protein